MIRTNLMPLFAQLQLQPPVVTAHTMSNAGGH
jgi:hypothetical protein